MVHNINNNLIFLDGKNDPILSMLRPCLNTFYICCMPWKLLKSHFKCAIAILITANCKANLEYECLSLWLKWWGKLASNQLDTPLWIQSCQATVKSVFMIWTSSVTLSPLYSPQRWNLSQISGNRKMIKSNIYIFLCMKEQRRSIHRCIEVIDH